ncbi:MAG: aminotransferase class I/II-fold pyridoxal phosphate-dependent enzyme [Flavobacteriaceae bacterium]|nr:aminotransferase class I/II-fold pyridoxal phosphate-dependent enzyme [Flavobacteriaceae bacterium]MCY4267506.1 aminotransferase class I/II-fold pyridoxal phosphate-dependent enzyme [Flavobacteriaceae bacterium]MCY4298042.1 aminotransferase class I/II-fold pyridoxal phosphate-dependent enzyme [Flavobacteriaceae bacterium]
MIEVAHRLSQFSEYYFSHKLREVEQLKKQGKPIINIGIGNPDFFPHESTLEHMISSLKDQNAHQYQSYRGLEALRDAISSYYQRVYQVQLDPQDEILPLMGSKEGIGMISLAYLNKGDQVLIPNPGYPTYASATMIAEAKPLYYHLYASNDWLPDLDEIKKIKTPNTKMMWLNYPHMPTGAQATDEIFEQLIQWAIENQVLLVHDNPYSHILNATPKSLLKSQMAKTIALELNSMSKSFNMAGWRIGMLCGSKKLIQPILKVKSNFDSGMFYGLQKGAIAALNLPDAWFDQLNQQYMERKKIVESLALKLGADFEMNQAGLFLWAKIPKGETSSTDFVDKLLYQHHLFVAPGNIFGSNGQGYIRMSVCAPTSQLKQALNRI